MGIATNLFGGWMENHRCLSHPVPFMGAGEDVGQVLAHSWLRYHFWNYYPVVLLEPETLIQMPPIISTLCLSTRWTVMRVAPLPLLSRPPRLMWRIWTYHLYSWRVFRVHMYISRVQFLYDGIERKYSKMRGNVLWPSSGCCIWLSLW